MADMLETRHARVLTRLRADYDDFSIALIALRHCSECSGDAAGAAVSRAPRASFFCFHPHRRFAVRALRRTPGDNPNCFNTPLPKVQDAYSLQSSLC
jgi:hypothetical protein